MRNVMMSLGLAIASAVAGYMGGTELARRGQSAALERLTGGVSLVYEIKAPAGYSGTTGSGQTLAEEVAEALKKRVDPEGVLNLLWRPQGDNRLEILIPRSPHAGER